MSGRCLCCYVRPPTFLIWNNLCDLVYQTPTKSYQSQIPVTFGIPGHVTTKTPTRHALLGSGRCWKTNLLSTVLPTTSPHAGPSHTSWLNGQEACMQSACVTLSMWTLTVSEVRAAADGWRAVQENGESSERISDARRSTIAEISRAEVVVGDELRKSLCCGCLMIYISLCAAVIFWLTLCRDSLRYTVIFYWRIVWDKDSVANSAKCE